MSSGDWVVVEVKGLYELHETWLAGPKLMTGKLFGTETVDRKLLKRIAELHNQVIDESDE
jgi:hypothetical protein